MKFSLKTSCLILSALFSLVCGCKAEADLSIAPKVVQDPSGNAVAIWERRTSTQRIIQAAVYTAGGGWAAAQDISAPSFDSFAPMIVMNSLGNAVAIWSGISNIEPQLNLFARELPAGGAWGPITNVSTKAFDIVDFRVGQFDPAYKVALNDDGDIVAVWSVNVGTGQVVHAATATFGGAWSAPVQISP